MRQRLRWIVALAGLLAACGGDDSEPQDEDVNDWAAYVAGGTDYDVQGGAVSMLEVNGNTHIDGADVDGNSLTIVVEEDPLSTRDYTALIFTLIIAGSPVYVCDGAGITISVLNLSPVRNGTFRGPVECKVENVVQFSGFVEGRFAETH